MKTKSILFFVLMLWGINTLVWSQAPLAGCWHPDFIKDWVPEKDPDRKFNRSTVPLQPRIPTKQTVKANNEQFSEGQVAACLTMHPMCSQVPAQGANNFVGYNPTYWQYLDLLVWWGGSAGEGIILPPSAPVIDAAHMSGVKVLGQIFFPPIAFSGNPDWTRQMNSTTGDGVYPYARKCAEIAKYYGFDGWFINSETITSANWTNWTKDYLRYAKEIGLEGQEIQLYNMASYVASSAQSVARQKGGSFMVNYGGVNSAIQATAGHTNENEWGNKFESYYAGIEQSGSYNVPSWEFDRLFPKSGHAASVNWFNPEEQIWKQVVKNLLETPNAQGSMAYQAMERVFKNEQTFWTNNQGDVTLIRNYSTRGLATGIQERSAIQNKPFVTAFSMGLGKHRFVNGEKRGTQDWYHRGMQSVMPTWRWWVVAPEGGSKSDIKFAYDWDDAYNMGTSIKLSGDLKNGSYTLNLYKTKITVAAGDKMEVVYKTNKANSIRLKLGTLSATTAITTKYEPTSTTVRNGWTVDTYDLSSLDKRSIYMISLDVNAGTDGTGFAASLGQIGIYPSNYTPKATQVANIEIQNDLAPTQGDLRIIWDHPADISQIDHYNVYLTRNGKTNLVGQTRNEGFYVPKFTRKGLDETSLSVSVKAVYKNMEESATGASVSASFPEVGLPEIQQVLASKSLLQPNEEVTFTVTATNFPTQYEWKAPEAGVGELLSQNGNTARYRFTSEGKHDVEVSVSNSIGSTTHRETKIVNVHAGSLKIVSRASNGGSVTGNFNGYDCNNFMVSSREHPGWLIDNVEVPGSLSNKWCAGGDKEHWTIITLDKIYELYRFRIHDCGNKENPSDNMTFYKIYTSVDKVNWEKVLDMQNVPATAAYNVKDHYISPVFAKYVKLVPYDPDKAITIRIWQFDVFGLEATPTPSLTELKADKRIVKVDEEVTFTVKASQNPTDYQWKINENSTLVDQEDSPTGSKAIFTFGEEGVYDISVTAINAGGEKTITATKMLQVSNSESLISLNKPVVLASHDEGKSYLTDGVTEPSNLSHRWNAKGASEYWAIVDLQANYDITRFVTYDCRSMEPVVLHNFNHYNVFTATTIDEQGKGDWKQVLRGRNAIEKNIKDDQLSTPVRARYVKFNPYDWALFETRVYEFEVYGKKVLMLPELGMQENFELEVGKKREISLTYNLKGEQKADNFAIDVKVMDGNKLSLSGKTVNDTHVNFTLTGNSTGSSKIEVILKNGTQIVKTEFTVTVKQKNGLSGLVASALSFWPNPVVSGESLHVQSEGLTWIRLFSPEGMLLRQEAATADVTLLSTVGLKPGIYLIQTSGKTSQLSKVLVK